MIEHGITISSADIWAHICPKAGYLYTYWTYDMKTWLDQNKPRSIDGHSANGAVTGQGFLVPCDLPFIRCTYIPVDLLKQVPDKGSTDTDVGLAVERLGVQIMKLGYWPNFLTATEISSARQVKGAGDFEVTKPGYSVEFKADMPGGHAPGTGNLFVQTHEFQHQKSQVRTEYRAPQ